MSKRLIVAGAGGFGRELVQWVDSSPIFCRDNLISSVAFIDDSATDKVAGVKVLGSVDSFVPSVNDLFVCAIALPESRTRVVRILEDKGATFVPFVHDTAFVGSRSVLGAGVILCPKVLVSVDVTIGRHTHLNVGSSIGHDAVLGEFNTLSSNCFIGGNSKLGNNVFVGTSVTVSPRLNIADDVVLGAGSVVMRSVKRQGTTYGNPAKLIPKRV
ncbi:NeuD/PglB/VioB family sugar acetyltransferase [Lysinibacter cavernae]|uniref:Sugar O-acyltransferase (Sialic acid O-acetyltransferase NeuD family) n=1 Tax=Lysinibacter cavernae TaxID=1640652 RepID=A0A7X5TT08_9MICO|nr:NeuD/PglB/VioB family sugar acetyltransferase [Lysinibacter cavernae]NIH54111.1 sugar O-acyltransferase (sialic acid O-acetyltransferase NeuD family) [Lysinibacter cavernae]